jgi:nucleoside-diphosphate-sugar epimerase
VLFPDQGILARWIDDLRDGQTVRAFTDHRLSPITLDDTLKAIGAITEHADGGVYQLSGGTDISFEEAARHLAARVGASQQKVIGVKAADSGVPSDEITPYTSLDTSRLKALIGYNPLHPRIVIDTVFAGALAKERLQ